MNQTSSLQEQIDAARLAFEARIGQPISGLSPYVRRRWERVIVSAVKRRLSLIAKRDGGVSAADWAAILEYHGNRCAYCLRSGLKLEADHVVALFRGGAHEPANIVPACVKCNRGKKDRPVFVMVNR